MSEPVSSEPAYAVLPDPWERAGAIPLNGVLERNKFHPVLVAFIALAVGMVGYMIVGNIATFALLLMEGVSLQEMAADLPGIMEEQAGPLLAANAIGLFLGMGLVAVLLVRLHSSRLWAFLRLRAPDATALVLSLLGLIAFIPVVQWAGSVNEMIPLPEWLEEIEQVQMELLESVLQGEVNVFFSLIMVAVTPALCEEIFFRGYIQRNFERGMGAAAGIIASGFFFGAFHLRLTQLLPLSLLGVYLAYLTWRTGSLWIPIIIHFANNAIAVATAEFVKNRPDMNITDLEQIDVPWYIVLTGLVVFMGIIYVLHERAEKQLAEQSAVSVDAPLT